MRNQMAGTFVVSCLALGSVVAPRAKVFAAVEMNSGEIKQSEQEQKQRMQALKDREKTLEASIKTKSRAYHALSQNSTNARFVWEEDSSATSERGRKLERLLQIAIREELKELEGVRAQEEDLVAELDMVKLRQREGAPPLNPDNVVVPAPTVAQADAFKCQELPVTLAEGGRLMLTQDFGARKDADTGIEWRSLGWWIGSGPREVKACATGKVVFNGKVPGRGRVVILEHAGGGITLYANLNDDVALAPQKGEVVGRGRVIGTPHEKFYFEARRNGIAVDPREVLPQPLLTGNSSFEAR
ncbi:MAG: M23 family metallopeptidase [Bdellovibrionales bacterium]|nr:M23 family metallopeptidase [Bdellovibrionales bacterium]